MQNWRRNLHFQVHVHWSIPTPTYTNRKPKKCTKNHCITLMFGSKNNVEFPKLDSYKPLTLASIHHLRSLHWCHWPNSEDSDRSRSNHRLDPVTESTNRISETDSPFHHARLLFARASTWSHFYRAPYARQFSVLIFLSLLVRRRSMRRRRSFLYFYRSLALLALPPLFFTVSHSRKRTKEKTRFNLLAAMTDIYTYHFRYIDSHFCHSLAVPTQRETDLMGERAIMVTLRRREMEMERHTNTWCTCIGKSTPKPN